MQLASFWTRRGQTSLRRGPEVRLLVTRPEPDATILKARLIAQGHEVLVEPLIEIDFEDTDPIEVVGAQALIATSRNGVRALVASPGFEEARFLPLFAVGPGTAASARAAGFTMVLQGPATGRDLVGFIAEHAEVNGGPLLHLAGDLLAFDFAAELRRLGFTVLQPVVYHSRPVERLSGSIAARLGRNEINGVLLLSPRTATIFTRLVEEHGLAEQSRRLTFYCISHATADRLADLQPFAIEIAREPNVQELLELTSRPAHESPTAPSR
jgi:uroporphyrinogen-III synthase